MKQTVTDEQMSWAIDHDPECHALWLEAIELARMPAPPPKPKRTLVELQGKLAEKAAANPSGVRVRVTDRDQVIGKFNAHLEDCVLFIADEAYWGGDKRCVGRLQGMITEPTLPIERKGFDVYQVKNFLHLLMLAEPGWVIPAGKHERRYAALNVNDEHRGDREYFKALHRQIEDGGAAAMFFDLQKMELGEWHPREIPEALLHSEALRQQQTLTLPPWEQWYLTLLQDGRLPGALFKHPNWSYTHSLLDSVKERVPRLKLPHSVRSTSRA